jgi:hypothetical protein
MSKPSHLSQLSPIRWPSWPSWPPSSTGAASWKRAKLSLRSATPAPLLTIPAPALNPSTVSKVSPQRWPSWSSWPSCSPAQHRRQMWKRANPIPFGLLARPLAFLLVHWLSCSTRWPPSTSRTRLSPRLPNTGTRMALAAKSVTCVTVALAVLAVLSAFRPVLAKRAFRPLAVLAAFPLLGSLPPWPSCPARTAVWPSSRSRNARGVGAATRGAGQAGGAVQQCGSVIGRRGAARSPWP